MAYWVFGPHSGSGIALLEYGKGGTVGPESGEWVFEIASLFALLIPKFISCCQSNKEYPPTIFISNKSASNSVSYLPGTPIRPKPVSY